MRGLGRRTSRRCRIPCRNVVVTAASVFAFIFRRVALIVPTFFGVTLLAFALIHLIPGDPVENLSGERGMDPGAARCGCCTSSASTSRCYVQYFDYIWQRAARRPRHVADHARAGADANS